MADGGGGRDSHRTHEIQRRQTGRNDDGLRDFRACAAERCGQFRANVQPFDSGESPPPEATVRVEGYALPRKQKADTAAIFAGALRVVEAASSGVEHGFSAADDMVSECQQSLLELGRMNRHNRGP